MIVAGVAIFLILSLASVATYLYCKIKATSKAHFNKKVSAQERAELLSNQAGLEKGIGKARTKIFQEAVLMKMEDD